MCSREKARDFLPHFSLKQSVLTYSDNSPRSPVKRKIKVPALPSAMRLIHHLPALPKLKIILTLLIWLGTALAFTQCSQDKEATNQAMASMPELPDPLEAGWEEESVCEVLVDNDFHRILKCTFPPGVGHEKHYHPPHTGYTLAGAKFQITDSTGTRTVDVPTGYVFGNDQISVHEVLNVGENTGEFLIIEPKQ